MRLNGIAPAPGAKKTHKRVGRGIGSGLGKTAGRGHKGQHARSGGFRKVGFEGGQMPLQRRVPKRGFRSMHKGERAELRLEQAAKAAVAGIVDRDALKARRLVRGEPEIIKIVAGGELNEPLVLRGLAVSRGARAAIEAAGGKVED